MAEPASDPVPQTLPLPPTEPLKEVEVPPTMGELGVPVAVHKAGDTTLAEPEAESNGDGPPARKPDRTEQLVPEPTEHLEPDSDQTLATTPRKAPAGPPVPPHQVAATLATVPPTQVREPGDV